MSLLGIDVGTSGCKAVAFSAEGRPLASAYQEYNFLAPEPGQAVLDSAAVWNTVKAIIARAAADTAKDPIRALSVSSMGEAMVPVTRDRRILGPSILGFDSRGAEYLPALRATLSDEELFAASGNTLGNDYGLTKLMWLRDREPCLYGEAELFLNWAAFVAFMLGGEPAVDYSLANRSLLFDLHSQCWSPRLLSWAGLDVSKLPPTVASATPLGLVSATLAEELGLPRGVAILAGAHDQCANALGCGVTGEGSAMFGMGTYLCIVPVYRSIPGTAAMIRAGLCAEHHVLADRYVTFIYNMSGAVVKWFRNTFAAEDLRQAQGRGEDVYDRLFAELPAAASELPVLPFFSPLGPPHHVPGSCGVIAGLSLGSTRGEILKGILQGAVFTLRERVDGLPDVGIGIRDYRAAGGGSKSDAWVQLAADILNKPFARPQVSEAGALGAAIMAGAGTGVFASLEEGAAAMVRLEQRFEPRPRASAALDRVYERYRRLWPLLEDYLAGAD